MVGAVAARQLTRGRHHALPLLEERRLEAVARTEAVRLVARHQLLHWFQDHTQLKQRKAKRSAQRKVKRSAQRKVKPIPKRANRNGETESETNKRRPKTGKVKVVLRLVVVTTTHTQSVECVVGEAPSDYYSHAGS